MNKDEPWVAPTLAREGGETIYQSAPFRAIGGGGDATYQTAHFSGIGGGHGDFSEWM